jgi:hypothetical protein
MSTNPRFKLTGCESSFLAIKQKTLGRVEYRVFPLKCNTWDCPVCAKIKAKKYRERMSGLFDGRRLWMYTFTYYHSRPALDVWREYSIAWNRFRTAAAKRYGRFSYARILEHHHKSPYPHLHILADKEFGAVWLAMELKTAGFGYQAVCKPITSEGAISYVTKYLSKAWTSEDCRRIRKSLGLRIISFGGDACGRRMAPSDWEVITRNCEHCETIDKCDIDRDWSYGHNARLISEKIVDAFITQVYILDNEVTAIFSGKVAEDV